MIKFILEKTWDAIVMFYKKYIIAYKRVKELESPYLCETCHKGLYCMKYTDHLSPYDETWMCNNPKCNAIASVSWKARHLRR